VSQEVASTRRVEVLRAEVETRPQPREEVPDPEPEPEPEPQVTAISLVADRTDLVEGDSVVLRLVDQAGAPVSGRFRSSDPSVASASPEGLMVALGAGRVTISATHQEAGFPELSTQTSFQVAAAVQPFDPTLLATIRTWIQEAQDTASNGGFDAAFALLDRSGEQLEDLSAQRSEFPEVRGLYDDFIEAYRETYENCERVADLLRTIPGETPPTCKEPPWRGPTRGTH
jgi:hypothetical protein